VNFSRYQAATHMPRVNCAEVTGGRPRQPACKIFSINRRFYQCWHRKLTQLWTGPWVVERFFSPIVVETSHPLARKRQTAHVDRLVPCLAPTENPAPEVESEPTVEPHYVPVLPPVYGPTADAGDAQSAIKTRAGRSVRPPLRYNW